MKLLLARDDVVRLSGLDADSRFLHWESGTGLALNVPARTVTVAAGANLKTYAFEDICAWASRSGPAGALAGLCVSIKDQDHPTWRIAMQDKLQREQWFAILAEVFVAGGAGRVRPRHAGSMS